MPTRRRAMPSHQRVPLRWQELRAGMQFLEITPEQLWIVYFAVGGSTPLREFTGWFDGTGEIPPKEHNQVAAAINDVFLDRGLGQSTDMVRPTKDEPSTASFASTARRW